MQDKYRLKFPELESLVHHPIDYARVVKAISNEMDITLVDLEDILPQVEICLAQVQALPCSMHSQSAIPATCFQRPLQCCGNTSALVRDALKVQMQAGCCFR